MAELIDIFARHEKLLRAAGWYWPPGDVAHACAAVEPARLAISTELLSRWVERDPAGFAGTTSAMFGNRVRLRAALLIDMLSFKHDFFLAALTDPAMGTVPEIAPLCRPLLELEPLLPVRLMKFLLHGVPEGDDGRADAMLERALVLLEATGSLDRFSIYVAQLLRYHDRRVRAKAALLMAKTNPNVSQTKERYARETDPRVRANLIEGLWNVHSPDKAAFFWSVTGDTHHRVVANALVGLCAMGEAGAVEKLMALANHRDPEMRTAAAWAMGKLADPRFREVLTRLAREERGPPKRNALTALVRIRQTLAPQGCGAQP
jgi:hypothetical protein